MVPFGPSEYEARRSSGERHFAWAVGKGRCPHSTGSPGTTYDAVGAPTVVCDMICTITHSGEGALDDRGVDRQRSQLLKYFDPHRIGDRENRMGWTLDLEVFPSWSNFHGGYEMENVGLTGRSPSRPGRNLAHELYVGIDMRLVDQDVRRRALSDSVPPNMGSGDVSTSSATSRSWFTQNFLMSDEIFCSAYLSSYLS